MHHHTSAYSTFTGPSETPVVTDSAARGRGLGTMCQYLSAVCILAHSTVQCPCDVTFCGLRRVQGHTQVCVHVSEEDTAPEGRQMGIIDRWRQGDCPGAPAKGVAGPAQQNRPRPCSTAY